MIILFIHSVFFLVVLSIQMSECDIENYSKIKTGVYLIVHAVIFECGYL